MLQEWEHRDGLPVLRRREASQCTRKPDIRERYAALGIEPIGSTPDRFAAEIKDDIAKRARIAKAASIRAE